MRVLPSGTDGLLLELGSLEEVLDRYAALREADLPVVDLVPAGRTILVVAERGADLRVLADAVRAVPPRDHGRAAGPTVEVPVVYDGRISRRRPGCSASVPGSCAGVTWRRSGRSRSAGSRRASAT